MINRGICNAIICNPTAGLKHFPYFCDAVVEFKNPGEELEKIFQCIMTTFKNSIGVQWTRYFAEFPADLRSELARRFGL